MKDGKIFLHKVRTAVLVLLTFAAMTGTGCGILSHSRQALAAKSTGNTGKESRTEAKKNTVEFQLAYLNQPFGEQPSGSLLKAAACKIVGKNLTAETVEAEVYDVVSTHALARDVMETLEQETLELMASPAGSVWGGMIKVNAGDTPLLITEEDKEVLLRIVEAEATSEDVKGRMLVANVILNRVISENFPDSIAEVVFQNNGVTYQFAPIKDGRYWTVKVSEKTVEAVERVLAGEDESRGALYFAARSMAEAKAMRWFDTSLKYLFRYGVHEFFTDKE